LNDFISKNYYLAQKKQKYFLNFPIIFKENGEWLLVDFTAERRVTSWEQDEYTGR
jgi:hypothetical protein